MRTLLRILLLLFLFAGTAKSQTIKSGQTTPAPHFTQLVLEVKNFSNQKHVQLINQALGNSLGASTVIAACEENSWVVLRLDLNFYNDPSQLLNLLKSTGIEYIIKDGATAVEVSTACKGAMQQF